MAALFILALAQFRYPFADRGLNLAWDGGCLAVALLGQVVRFFTVGFVPRGTSGRNTRGQVAETLNTTGMYAVVRNPIYLGNFIIWFGLSLFMKSVWFTTVIVLFFTIFYERIIFREEGLFAAEVRRRLHGSGPLRPPPSCPKFKNWRPPSLPFSFKSAINREYGTFFAIIATFTVLELLAGLFNSGKLTLDAIWVKLFIFSGVLYLTIRYLKKKTKVLATAGR